MFSTFMIIDSPQDLHSGCVLLLLINRAMNSRERVEEEKNRFFIFTTLVSVTIVYNHLF